MLLPGELELIARLGVLNPKIVVDVGAGWGEYTQTVKQFYHQIQIASFDPQSGTPAIGDEDGELELLVFPHVPYRTTGCARYKASLEPTFSFTRKVPLRRLDSLFSEQIDLLKIDVEGMEMEVLRGLGQLRPTIIQFEFGFANTCQGLTLGEFANFFTPWGYDLFQLDWDSTYGNFLAATAESIKALYPCTTQK